MMVAMKTDPHMPVPCPTHQLKPLPPNKSDKFFEIFLPKLMKTQDLVDAYAQLLSLNIIDSRAYPLPRFESKEVKVVFESEHPYTPHEEDYFDIEIPGAESMEISFDERSSCEFDETFLRFYKDATNAAYYGEEKYTGSAAHGDRNWPGVEGTPSLIIPSSFARGFFNSSENNDEMWGYSFTVKAICKEKVTPPPLAPLCHLTINRQLNMMGLQSLRSLINAGGSSNWLLPSIFSSPHLTSSIVATAVAPLPVISSNASQPVKPLTFESNHPYENSLDQYIPVSIRGAKRIIVSFDPQTRTESGCDYVRFYKDSSYSTVLDGAESFSGGKDGGSSNWPGMGDREPYVVEGDSFVIYFHTDGSVNDWGWLMTCTPVMGSDSPTSVSSNGEDVDCSPAPEEYRYDSDLNSARTFTLQKVLMNGATSHIAEDVSAKTLVKGSDKFQLKTLPARSPIFVDLSERHDSNSTSTASAVAVAVAGVVAGASQNPPSVASAGGSTSTSSINNEDTWPRGYVALESVESVFMLARPHDDAELLRTITRNKMFLATKVEGDWIFAKQAISTSSSSSGDEEGDETEGWVRFRRDDEIRLKPDNTVPVSAMEIISLPYVDEEDGDNALGGEKKSSDAKTKHPMYAVSDEGTDLSDEPLSSAFLPVNFIRANVKNLEKSYSDFAAVSVISFANDCISEIISKCTSPGDGSPSITTSFFGSPSHLLTYINGHYLNSLGNGAKASQSKKLLNSLASALLIAIRSSRRNDLISSASSSSRSVGNFDGHALSADLVRFASEQLSVNNEEVVPAPTLKAKVKTIESAHPYTDNMNQNWEILIPGATTLKLSFDPRSATEYNYDYIEIFDSIECTKKLYNKKIHGPIERTERHWPGVNAPPIVIKSDRCVVNMKSDGGTVDWGFKCTIHGIVGEPDEVELKRYREYKKARDLRAKFHGLSVWLLETLCKVEGDDYLEGLLYSEQTFHALEESLQAPCENDDPNSMSVISLLTTMVNEMPKRHMLTHQLMQKLSSIRESLIKLTGDQYKAEADQGSSPSNTSQLLQARMQLIVFIDGVLSSGKSFRSKQSFNDLSSSLSPSTNEYLPPGVVVAMEAKNDPAMMLNDRMGLLRWVPDPLSPGLELANSGRFVRKLPPSSSSSPSTSTSLSPSTAVGKFGFNTGMYMWSVCIVSLHSESSSPIIGLAQLPPNPNNTSTGSSDAKIHIGWSSRGIHISGQDEPIEWGPKMSVGDIISVCVDVDGKSVTIYRNEACVGRAIGPVDSDAKCKMELGPGPFYPAVTLFNDGDAVEFVELGKNSPLSKFSIGRSIKRDKKNDGNNINATSGSGSTGSASGKVNPDWLKPIKDSLAALRSCASHDLSSSLLHSKFLPICVNKSKLLIRSPADWNGMTTMEHVVSIPGAESISVIFDYTKLGKSDTVLLRDVNGQVVHELYGLDVKGIKRDNLAWLISHVSQFELRVNDDDDDDGVNNDRKVTVIEVGDTVVRGPDWSQEMYGDRDGGCGNRGTVTKITAWNGGKENSAIGVQWHNHNAAADEDTTLYRWDVDGAFDVAVVHTTKKVTKTGVKRGDNVFHVRGDKVTLEIIPASSSPSSTPPSSSSSLQGGMEVESIKESRRLYHAHFVPTYTVHSACAQPIFREELEFLKSQYLGGTLASDLALVRHIDSVAHRKSMSLSKLLSAPWSEFVPTKGELVRSPALKMLAELSPPDASVMNVVNDDPIDYEDNIPGTEGSTNAGSSESDDTDMNEEEAEGHTDGKQPTVHQVEGGGFYYGPHENMYLSEYVTVEGQHAFPDLDFALSVGLTMEDCGGVTAERDSFGNITSYTLRKSRELLPSPSGEISYVFISDPSEAVSITSITAAAATAGGSMSVAGGGGGSSTGVGMPASSSTSSSSSGKGNANKGETFNVVKPIEARFKILQSLNAALKNAIPYINLAEVKEGRISSVLSSCRGLIFEHIKEPILASALDETIGNGGKFELRLSRSRARKYISLGVPDHDARFTVYAQAFRQMRDLPASVLRRAKVGDGQLYTTTFMGERSQDAGGPYRESFAMYAQELQSDALPLLIKTPNGKLDMGYNRDRYLLHPNSTSPTHLDMFEFLGKLMGVAIRSKEYMALNIAPIIWKLLANDTITIEDLESVDSSFVKSLQMMMDKPPEVFESIFVEYPFTVHTSDSREMPLLPNADTTLVTPQNLSQYFELAIQYRLHEFDRQVAAVRSGLAQIVPITLLNLFTGHQLETLVCGQQEIDVSLLESITEYSGCSSSDAHVRLFWRAMEEFNNEERAAMLRFTWGRSRLPLTAAGFIQRFKIQSFSRSPPTPTYQCLIHVFSA